MNHKCSSTLSILHNDSGVTVRNNTLYIRRPHVLLTINQSLAETKILIMNITQERLSEDCCSIISISNEVSPVSASFLWQTK